MRFAESDEDREARQPAGPAPLTAEERVLRWATRYCSDMGAGPNPREQADIDAVRQKLAEAERLKKDGGSLAQRELKDHYEREFHRAFAEAELLRAVVFDLQAEL